MERYHHRRVILEQGDDTTAAGTRRPRVPALDAHRVRACARAGPARRHLDGAGGRVRPARAGADRDDDRGAVGRRRDRRAAERREAVDHAAQSPTRFFAAIVDDRVAAYCELRSDGRTAQIEDVEAVRAYRGRGLGRAIVQHALDEARRDPRRGLPRGARRRLAAPALREARLRRRRPARLPDEVPASADPPASAHAAARAAAADGLRAAAAVPGRSRRDPRSGRSCRSRSPGPTG